jgi:hypothetical protein
MVVWTAAFGAAVLIGVRLAEPAWAWWVGWGVMLAAIPCAGAVIAARRRAA